MGGGGPLAQEPIFDITLFSGGLDSRSVLVRGCGWALRAVLFCELRAGHCVYFIMFGGFGNGVNTGKLKMKISRKIVCVGDVDL